MVPPEAEQIKDIRASSNPLVGYFDRCCQILELSSPSARKEIWHDTFVRNPSLGSRGGGTEEKRVGTPPREWVQRREPAEVGGRSPPFEAFVPRRGCSAAVGLGIEHVGPESLRREMHSESGEWFP